MQVKDFNGAKLAVLCAGQVLTFLRDDRRDIPYPGMWELPGGGREAGESPVECALRETWEETGLMLRPQDVVWQREYVGGSGATWFLVAEPGWLCLPAPRLGTEGQAVRWMPVAGFLARRDAVGHLQARLGDFLGLQSERGVVGKSGARFGGPG